MTIRLTKALLRPAIVLVLLALGGLSACASHGRSGSAYTGVPAGERDPAKAEQLHTQALDLLDKSPKDAEKLLREALATDLYHGPAHNNLGTLLLLRGELFEAAGEFEWARKLLPGHPDPRLNLAYTLELAGRTDDALATYATALEVYPEHIPTLQAITRLQVRSRKVDELTLPRLRELSLRGETPAWRDWARLQVAKLEK